MADYLVKSTASYQRPSSNSIFYPTYVSCLKIAYINYGLSMKKSFTPFYHLGRYLQLSYYPPGFVKLTYLESPSFVSDLAILLL